MKIRRNLSRRPAGFTLLELIVAVGILGILASLAAPSFKDMMADQRIKSASFEITAALTLARGEARKQNGNVTLTPISCDTSWASGWTITGPGVPTDCPLAPGTEVISSQGAHPGITITGPASIVYNRTGRSSAGATLQVSNATSGSTVPSRFICVGVTGQPKSQKESCP